ncbi:MAG: hypothetical protein ACRDE7_01900 [Sphingobacterium sp.]
MNMQINMRLSALKFISLIILWGLSPVDLTAQNVQETNLDSLTFEAQRERVNKLLEDRSQRFGEYDQSLEKKTGVFGLFKTKADMQKSIDILRKIVLNDNNIFLETRKLLDLKDAQSERIQRLANEYDQQVSAYMKTITKLQNENDKLRAEIDLLEDEDRGSGIQLYLAFLVILGLILLLFRLNWDRIKKKID